ncbi:MAG: hypothetical protein FWG40_09360, partial [Peptococcaceae bacterium]|nr:hypothetical protein [Peptococcaceae bacterium]
QTQTISGNQIETVTGDQTETVSGSRTDTVEGAEDLTVLQDRAKEYALLSAGLTELGWIMWY